MLFRSTFGRVRNKKTNRILTPSINHQGYCRVFLSSYPIRRQVFIHRLVGEAFIPNPDNLKTIDHIDNNPSNNLLENLRWLSHNDNINRRKCVVGASISYNSKYTVVSYITDGKQNNMYFKNYDDAEAFYFEKCSDCEYY